MRYFISIDASGSKTEAVLVDETGLVVAREKEQGANALDIGSALVIKRISDVINNLIAHIPSGGKLAQIFGSVSAIYYYPEIQDQVKRHIRLAHLKFDSIVTSVMAIVLGKGDGVCLISGTGSYCCVRTAGQHRKYFGSSGYLLDIGGSAYSFGQQALVAALRDRDGRGPKTMLADLIEKDIREPILDHLPVIYAGGRPYIASFASNVFTANQAGDAVARQIFDGGVNYFAETLGAAYDYLGKPFKAALGGGVFLHQPGYVEAIRRRAPSGCELKVIDVPAVYGGVLEALWMDGKQESEEFKENFIKSYQTFAE